VKWRTYSIDCSFFQPRRCPSPASPSICRLEACSASLNLSFRRICKNLCSTNPDSLSYLYFSQKSCQSHQSERWHRLSLFPKAALLEAVDLALLETFQSILSRLPDPKDLKDVASTISNGSKLQRCRNL